ncbi:MAG: leucyl aminopeptidase [Alphaproteobacteria bacterium]
MKVSFTTHELPKKATLILLAGAGEKKSPPVLGKEAAALDEAAKGGLTRAMEIAQFKAAHGTFLDLVAPAGLAVGRILIAGIGAPKKAVGEELVALGGAIAGQLSGLKIGEAAVRLDTFSGLAADPAELGAALALGARLRAYRFDHYKSKKPTDDRPPVIKIAFQCADPAGAKRAYEPLASVADGVIFARDLVNEPANVLYPASFAKRLKKLEKFGIKVEILDRKALRKIGMGALLSVGLGSRRGARVVVMRWSGGADKAKPLVFVGKGVTFDTGGISLKPPANMGDMKGDMAGAACVGGLMHALAARKAKINAIGIVGLVENMPDGRATRPGDVVTSLSGQTIEVLNTDAEGRLVLADILTYARTQFKPRAMIDLATLTGAIVIALGNRHAGIFSNDDKLCEQLSKAGTATSEKVWRLPLDAAYDKLMDSKVADMKNTGGRSAGSITAAQFLQRFVEDTPWVHIDIAGVALDSPKTAISQGWTSGFGVRLLNQLVADNFEGGSQK